VIGIAEQLVTNTDALCDCHGPFTSVCPEAKRAVNAIRQQDIVERIQVFEQLEFPKDQSDICDSKVTPGRIMQPGDFVTVSRNQS
jgi:hypothetical protein